MLLQLRSVLAHLGQRPLENIRGNLSLQSIISAALIGIVVGGGFLVTMLSVSLGTLYFDLGIAGMVAAGFMILAIAVRGHRSLAVPLRHLVLALQRLTAGELSVRVEEGGVAEIGELTRGFNRMAESLEVQHDELARQRDELDAQQVELERALSEVEERKAYAETLQRTADRLAAASGIDSVSDVALRELADVARAEVGAIYLLDHPTASFFLAGRRGVDARQIREVLVPRTGLAGRALAEGRPIDVSYGRTELSLPGLTAGRRSLHELHLPLLYGHRTIGVVSLGRTRDESFAPGDVDLLKVLGERVAPACVEALAVQRLERVVRQLEAVLEAIDVGVYCTDLEGRVTLVNRAALEQTGFSPQELLGHRAHDLVHHTRPDGTPCPRGDCRISHGIQEGRTLRVDDEVVWRRDGTSLPVELSCRPLLEGDEVIGAVVTTTSITQRLLVRRQRDTHRAVTRVLAEGVGLEELPGRMLGGLSAGLGWLVGLIWGPSDGDAPMKCLKSYAVAGMEELEGKLAGEAVVPGVGPAGLALVRHEPVVIPDLDVHPPRPGSSVDGLLQSAVAVPINGSDDRVLAVAEFFGTRDLAQQGIVDTLTQIAALMAQYVERKLAEQEAQRLQEEFVATVSHELRTPLTAIDGWLDILLGGEPGPLNDDQRRFLSIVKRNSDRLMRLVDDLLLAGHLEAGELSLEMGDVDAVRVAEEATELIMAPASEKGLTVTLDAPSRAVVRGDRARLLQLIGNLLANAVKFTPKGGKVSVGVRARAKVCRITVVDTGIGIPSGERKRIFERFYRASSATDRGITGAGLGLAICRAIAESHGGTIRLAEHEGPGTVFLVEIPLAPCEEGRR